MNQINLKTEINAEELVSLIWEKKQFATTLLKNSIGKSESGEFQARVILDTVDFCLQKILELQAK